MKVPDGFLAIQDESGTKHAIDIRNRPEDAPSLWEIVPVCGLGINANPPDIFTETDCVRCESIVF